MLGCVTFAYVDRALGEEKFRKKKATIPLHLLLPCVSRLKAVWTSSSECAKMTTSSRDVGAVDCVGVDAQLLLAASTSAVWAVKVRKVFVDSVMSCYNSSFLDDGWM